MYHDILQAQQLTVCLLYFSPIHNDLEKHDDTGLYVETEWQPAFYFKGICDRINMHLEDS